LIKKEPFYLDIKGETEIFEKAFYNKLPVLLKGPTGCGKTRFVEYMAYKLKIPLITVSCHDDLTATDLLGRYLLIDGKTEWKDGPLTLAVRYGGICYLDEIVEARKDTTVVIHSVTDHRRILSIEKTDEVIEAHENFMLVISYNPGYQSVIKNLKQSTKQRFVAIEFDYPKENLETQIVKAESGLEDEKIVKELVKLGNEIRNMKKEGLEEGASTRLLVYAAKLIKSGIDPVDACKTAILNPITDETDHKMAIEQLITDFFIKNEVK